MQDGRWKSGSHGAVNGPTPAGHEASLYNGYSSSSSHYEGGNGGNRPPYSNGHHSVSHVVSSAPPPGTTRTGHGHGDVNTGAGAGRVYDNGAAYGASLYHTADPMSRGLAHDAAGYRTSHYRDNGPGHLVQQHGVASYSGAGGLGRANGARGTDTLPYHVPASTTVSRAASLPQPTVSRLPEPTTRTGELLDTVQAHVAQAKEAERVHNYANARDSYLSASSTMMDMVQVGSAKYVDCCRVLRHVFIFCNVYFTYAFIVCAVFYMVCEWTPYTVLHTCHAPCVFVSECKSVPLTISIRPF